MSFLLVYIGETENFDPELVRSFLHTCSRVSEIKEHCDERSLYTAHFDYADDSTIFDLHSNLETVSISGTGFASIQLCHLFQASYPKPLHVIDEGYNFDLVIRDFGSARELEEAMVREWNKPAEESG
jgi:hypothetical protein